MKHLLLTIISLFVAANAFAMVCSFGPHENKWALKVDGIAVHTFNDNEVDFQAGLEKRDEFVAKGHCTLSTHVPECMSVVGKDEGRPVIYIIMGQEFAKKIGGSGTLYDSDFEAAKEHEAKYKAAGVCK
jgi:hypothetical protein